MHNKDIKELAKKRLQTAFIFAIAEVEDLFGHLWGDDIEDYNQLTTQQREWEKVFIFFRKRVLDNGNAQIRALLEDLENNKE